MIQEKPFCATLRACVRWRWLINLSQVPFSHFCDRGDFYSARIFSLISHEQKQTCNSIRKRGIFSNVCSCFFFSESSFCMRPNVDYCCLLRRRSTLRLALVHFSLQINKRFNLFSFPVAFLRLPKSHPSVTEFSSPFVRESSINNCRVSPRRP